MAALLYLVLALIATASAAPENRANRLVGGTPTSIEDFPYIVSIVYTYTGPGITIQRCVGSLISSWHVLTSAFCFTGAIKENMLLRAGSTNSLSGGSVASVSDVTQHPSYNEIPRSNDIAVIFLNTPFFLSNVIDILYLPPVGTTIPDGYDVEVVSWGFESIGGPQLQFLQTIILNKVNTDDCAVQLADSSSVIISDDVICASATGRGVCSGDSGAPMVIGQTVVGLASYYEGCDSDTYPDVFTRIDTYTPWILEVATGPESYDVNIRSRPVSV